MQGRSTVWSGALLALVSAATCQAGDAPTQTSEIVACGELPERSDVPLLEDLHPGYAPLAPGLEIGDPAAFLASGSPRWQLLERVDIRAHHSRLTVLTLDWPGNGGALAFGVPGSRGLRIVNIYAVDFGGNGVTLTIADRWTDPDCTRMILLIKDERHHHDPVAEGALVEEESGDEELTYEGIGGVSPSTETSWIAVGGAHDRAWLASERIRGAHSVVIGEDRLQLVASGPRPRTYEISLRPRAPSPAAPRP